MCYFVIWLNARYILPWCAQKNGYLCAPRTVQSKIPKIKQTAQITNQRMNRKKTYIISATHLVQLTQLQIICACVCVYAQAKRSNEQRMK